MALSYGLKIATPGSDVATQLAKDLAFTSQYPSLKIVKVGDISVTTDGSGNGTSSVDHNLGFTPAFFTFRSATAQWTTLDASSYANSYIPDPGIVNSWGGDYQYTLHTYTDSTKIYLQAKGAAASTTYTIHYVLLMDIAAIYSGADVPVNNNIGFKVSREGADVMEAKQYELAYSSRYKSLQYYDVNYKTTTLTLPIMFSSPIDTYTEEGTYADINHGLGYPPFFLAFFQSNITNTTRSVAVPYIGVNGQDVFSYAVSSFCDATRVRISFWRSSTFFAGSPSPNFNYEETVTVKVYIFTEDLTKTFNVA